MDLNEIVDIKISATDNEGIKNIILYVDGDPLDTLTTEPYKYSWNTTIYQDSTNHSILARAKDKNNNISDSDMITVTVNNEGFVPPSVTITKREISGDNISLFWSQSKIIDFSSYEVYRSFDGENFNLIRKVTDIMLTTYIDTVTQGNDYYYQIKLTDLSGLFSRSNILKINASDFNPNATILTIENNKAKKTLDLEWDKNNNIDFSHYKLYRSLNSGIDTLSNHIFTTQQQSTTFYRDENIQEGIKYYYKLYVFDNANLSSSTNELNGIMKQDPEPVTLEIKSTAEDSVSLVWSQSEDILFSHYSVYRSTSPDITINLSPLYTTSSKNELKFSDMSISGGDTYYYSIAVFDQVGNYSFSSIVQTTIPLITRYIVPTEYSTIADAIIAADFGDTVLVEDGHYYENITLDKSVVLGSLFLLDNDETHINNTFLNGTGINTPITINYNAKKIELLGLHIKEGSTAGAVIIGADTEISIGNCKISNNLGTGIQLNSSNISLSISNTEIYSNQYSGIEINSENTSLNITSCKIFDNNNGISFSQSGCNISLSNSELYSNLTCINASGAYKNNRTVSISECSFYENSNVLNFNADVSLDINKTFIYDNDNSESGYRSLICLGNDVTASINESEIYNNNTKRIIYTDEWYGSGAVDILKSHIHDNSSSEQFLINGADLENCIFNDNVVNQYLLYGGYIVNTAICNNSGGNGVFFLGGGTLLNSIIWGNSMPVNYTNGDVMYSDIQETISGTGNLNSDPLFSDGLFHLSNSSPCKDKGNPSPDFNDTDGTRNDIGAYGGPNGNW